MDIKRRAAAITFDRDMEREVVALVQEAIAEEREACARIAESGHEYALPKMADFQRSIARSIRTRLDR